ncbi:hypothetical protein M408DRAFT_331724 [Serendipita vermifera MAFF 305830]|nr:hypothetical protein M408DRAFT_331724 [Serendipita vermifera MAFF 305830]
MILNAASLAAFSDKFSNEENLEAKWRVHVERYRQYERGNRSRLGFRMRQFDEDEDKIHPLDSATGRWKWAKCDEELERPLEIRRFRAWSLSKPLESQ